MINISRLQLTNCTFWLNQAGHGGGAFSIEEFHHFHISSCHFNNNTSVYGGAIVCMNRKAGHLFLEHSKFLHNMARQVAGALYLNATSANVSQVEFIGNKGLVASAIYFDGKLCILTAMQTLFYQNNLNVQEQPHDGSAIFVHSITYFLISNATFDTNYAGGGIMLVQSKGRIHNCTFYRNSGFAAGAVVASSASSELIITDSSFVGNTALSGAALTLHNKITLIQSCYFAINVGQINPSVIGIAEREISDVRSYNNVFAVTNEMKLSPLETVMAFSEPLKKAVLFLWKTSCQFGKDNIQPIDQAFLENESMPNIVLTNDINVTQLFSPFASG